MTQANNNKNLKFTNLFQQTDKGKHNSQLSFKALVHRLVEDLTVLTVKINYKHKQTFWWWSKKKREEKLIKSY